MTATDEQVNELARWLQERMWTWNGFTDLSRQGYRHAAHALLEYPPPVLLDALGACVPDAVVGRAADAGGRIP